MTPLIIQYSSLRSEVWAQYWRLWKQKLWRIHIGIFALVALGLSFVTTPVFAIVCGLTVCLLFALYPMVTFKPQIRSFTINDAGIETSIGSRYGKVAWHEVGDIIDENGIIVIRRTNGNAFLIPERAFATSDDRSMFLTAARAAWTPLKP